MPFKVDAKGYKLAAIAKGLAVALEAYPSKLLQKYGIEKRSKIDKVSITNLDSIAPDDEFMIQLKEFDIAGNPLLASGFLFDFLRLGVFRYINTDQGGEAIAALEKTREGELLTNHIDITAEILQYSQVYDNIHNEFLEDTGVFVSSKQIAEDVKESLAPLFVLAAKDNAGIKAKISSIKAETESIKAQTNRLGGIDEGIAAIKKKLGIS